MGMASTSNHANCRDKLAVEITGSIKDVGGSEGSALENLSGARYRAPGLNHSQRTVVPLAKWVTIEIRNSTRKMMNSILAIPAEATAIPVNPKTPAINATTKKTSAQ